MLQNKDVFIMNKTVAENKIFAMKFLNVGERDGKKILEAGNPYLYLSGVLDSSPENGLYTVNAQNNKQKFIFQGVKVGVEGFPDTNKLVDRFYPDSFFKIDCKQLLEINKGAKKQKGKRHFDINFGVNDNVLRVSYGDFSQDFPVKAANFGFSVNAKLLDTVLKFFNSGEIRIGGGRLLPVYFKNDSGKLALLMTLKI